MNDAERAALVDKMIGYIVRAEDKNTYIAVWPNEMRELIDLACSALRSGQAGSELSCCWSS